MAERCELHGFESFVKASMLFVGKNK